MSDGLKAFDDTVVKKEIEKVTLEDIVVIGNAEPDELRDGRKSVCTVGYHPDYRLMRIYPVPPESSMNRWNVVQMSLERNPQDTRKESWKIQGSKEKQLSEKIIIKQKLTREEQLALLEELKQKFSYGCVEDINQAKMSLGFIKPHDCTSRFVKRDDHDVTVQKNLFTDKPFLTIHNFDVQPRMTYRCSDCKVKKHHDQQILEWGVYEGIRKNPNHKDKILNGLHIGDSAYDLNLLVGNLALHRTSFTVISIYRFKR